MRRYSGIEEASLQSAEAIGRNFLVTSLWNRLTFGEDEGGAGPPRPVPGVWALVKKLWALYGAFREAFGGAKARELVATLIVVLIEAGKLLLERWARERG